MFSFELKEADPLSDPSSFSLMGPVVSRSYKLAGCNISRPRSGVEGISAKTNIELRVSLEKRPGFCPSRRPGTLYHGVGRDNLRISGGTYAISNSPGALEGLVSNSNVCEGRLSGSARQMMPIAVVARVVASRLGSAAQHVPRYGNRKREWPNSLQTASKTRRIDYAIARHGEQYMR